MNSTAIAFFEESDIISTYSRAQAVEDGVLVDVSATMREAGITTKTALTRTVYEDCVAWTDADTQASDVPGRKRAAVGRFVHVPSRCPLTEPRR